MNTTADGQLLTRIRQISVNARDLERAVAFYRDVLGMKLLFQVPKMAFFDCGGVRLMLAVAERAEFDHAGSVLYYEVKDLAGVHDGLRRRGVVFEGEPHIVHRAEDHDLWMAFFRDTEGNLLALMTERPR
jgi:catechol 2,3-dioxygenase-like lactoylglutathione lyase family enzyme